MKKLLAIIVLGICFTIPSQANDIKEFEIEGISVGKNLIDFFDEEKILKHQKMAKSKYKSDKYLRAHFTDGVKLYDQIGIHFKKNKPYQIGSISGEFVYRNNIDKCYSKQSDLVNDIQKLFPENKYVADTIKYNQDPTKKSTNKRYVFYLDSGRISVNCVDWSMHIESKLNWVDHLRVTIETKKFRKWVNEEAY